MSPAREARETAGLSREEAARRARVSPDYLKKLESGGQFSYVLACRLSRIYGASGRVFLTMGRGTKKQAAGGAESTGRKGKAAR